jgi:hypothetical protein
MQVSGWANALSSCVSPQKHQKLLRDLSINSTSLSTYVLLLKFYTHAAIGAWAFEKLIKKTAPILQCATPIIRQSTPASQPYASLQQLNGPTSATAA